MKRWVYCLSLALLSGCSFASGPESSIAAPTPILAAAETSFSAPTPTVGAPSATPGAGPALATPVSDSPAAGICAGIDDSVVTVTIYPDIPDPRCTLIRPDQILRVVNQRAEVLQVSLAGLTATIDPGAEHVFDVTFGQLLAPGVHRVEVSPCCGAELWLTEAP